jgi:hypothetical protein
MNDQRPLYDRQLLLLGAKRNAVLELWEVQRYGSDSYGMSPSMGCGQLIGM